MPIVSQKQTDSFQLLVWKIEEPISFFSEAIQMNKTEMEEYGNISFESRKLEWLATRYIQRLLVADSLVKDEFGKPHLKENKGFISIAHCKGFAAVIYAKQKAVGVDIEPINDKVQRIAQKFLSKKELDFIPKSESTPYYICCWSIKEAIYKWYGKKELSFKNNIQIQDFRLTDKRASVFFTRDKMHEFKEVSFEKIDNILLAYTV